jgi:hypothetical protein
MLKAQFDQPAMHWKAWRVCHVLLPDGVRAMNSSIAVIKSILADSGMVMDRALGSTLKPMIVRVSLDTCFFSLCGRPISSQRRSSLHCLEGSQQL